MKTTINGHKIETFKFPDGQPHVNIPEGLVAAPDYTIRCSIRNSDELLNIMQLNEILRRKASYVNLEIAYLMGARMDRPIDENQPFTLKVITDILNSANFNKITLFNVHSEVSEKLLRAKNILPKNQINEVLALYPGIKLVSPDKGAFQWLNRIMSVIVKCSKVREMATGKLSGFKIEKPELVNGEDVLIADDLCDGGGTFVGLAKELKKAGAQKIILYVSHGIFSKGLPLEGIDHIYTTNSYSDELVPDKLKNYITIKNISWS